MTKLQQLHSHCILAARLSPTPEEVVEGWVSWEDRGGGCGFHNNQSSPEQHSPLLTQGGDCLRYSCACIFHIAVSLGHMDLVFHLIPAQIISLPT